MTVAGAVAASTLLAAAPAQAGTTYDVTGVLQNYDGSASGAEIIACRTDCSAGGVVDDYTFMSSATGTFTLNLPAAAVYHLAIRYLDLEPNYKSADGARVADGWLSLPAGSTQYNTDGTFAGGKVVHPTSTSSPLNIGTIKLGQAIHNPQSQFHQVTPGTIGQQPCAGHPTTFQPTGFSDLPPGGTVTYQWYAGSSSSTATPIPGATGLTYTSTAGQVGQSLYVEMKASAPNRVSYDGEGYLGAVGNGASCVPTVVVASWGHKVGKAVHGKKVAVKGARAPGAGASYNWMLNGKVVHHGASYKLPAKAKRKKLTVQIVFTEAGYQTVAHVTSFGKVK